MQYWLLKTEPHTYSWLDLEKEKKTIWDGVRNYQARNNLKKMKKGDVAFFYHSGSDKAIVGMVNITKEYFPDPTDEEWTAVEVTLKKKLNTPITLSQIKAIKKLSNMVLVRFSRLSVQPVRKEEFHAVLAMGEPKSD